MSEPDGKKPGAKPELDGSDRPSTVPPDATAGNTWAAFPVELPAVSAGDSEEISPGAPSEGEPTACLQAREDDEPSRLTSLPGEAASEPLPGTDDEGQARLAPLSEAAAWNDADGATRLGASPGTATARATSDRDEDGDRTRIAASPSNNATGTSPDTPPETDTTAAPEGAATPLGIGTTINNNYKITAVLKSGGMGAVYRGIEIGTGDPVAIKAIRAELAEDQKAGLLFKREARTLRQLADEAIVRYYNYVHDRDLGRYFLVMEFIEGVPLSEHIALHGAIPVPAVQTLIKRLTGGLTKAHGQDVIHRDLSPDNVMLPGDDMSDARLIDFGIAKSNVVQEGTTFGQFAGKLKYVAPEQLGAYGGIVGPATDIYGLALLVCAAATGKPLEMGASTYEAVRLRQTIPDLSAVPEELRPLLAFMLEPDPANRPASMDVVQRMLLNPQLIPARYFEGRPPPPPVEVTSGDGFAAGTSAAFGVSSSPPSLPPGLQVPRTGAGGLVGATTATTGLPPRTRAPSTLPPLDAGARPRGGAGGWVLGLLALLFVIILGAVTWFAWSNGLLGGGSGPAPARTTASAATGHLGRGIPEPDTTTRDGFLAALDTGPCSFAARVTAGPKAGMVEGYSASGESFAGLPTAYEEKFGARPEILPREVAAPQCAVLDFAKALEGRGRQGVSLRLPADHIASGEAINASIGVTGNQVPWVVLVSPLGGVYNLTDRMSDAVGGQRGLRFGLSLAPGSAAAPQLLLAVASDTPLARAAVAPDGSLAGELLPRVLDEIAGRGGGSSVALRWLMLEPATPDSGAPPTAGETGTDSGQ